MVRTQLYLDEKIHNRLQEIARKQHRSISELVREALARVYGETSLHELRRTLWAIEGLWKDRDDIGHTRVYVRRLRRGPRRKGRLGI